MWARGVVVGVVALLVAGVVSAPAQAAAADTVATEDGVVRGAVASDGRSFKGLPYAAPPVGARRFAAPAAPARWAGTRTAKESGSACAQAFPLIGARYPSSEDCLYLDVYTPPAARSHALPVMVWFHGGGYLVGSAGQYDPAPLVARDVIVVQANYRVGPFGFLALPGRSTNFGLQDQVAALRWVRTNAAAFGGDPGNVTVFGESAGGSSICQHLASPAARGLFQRAIVQSGGCGSDVLDAVPAATAQAASLAYAAEVGCPGPEVLGCLRGRSRADLLAPASTRLSSVRTGWRPSVDGVVVPRRSSESFATGDVARVPVLIGGQRDEGRFFVAVFDHALTGFRRVSPERFDTRVREVFGARAPDVRTRYPRARYGNDDLALAQVWTDGVFACPGLGATRSLAARTTTYAYEFDENRPPFSNLDPLMPLRSLHGSDLFMLFDRAFSVPLLHRNGAQQRLSDEMAGYWTAFARTGDPNGGGRPVWPEASSGSVLKLTSDGSTPKPLSTVAAEHDCGFWTR